MPARSWCAPGTATRCGCGPSCARAPASRVDRSSAAVSVHTRGRRRGEHADYDITVPAWMGVNLHGVNTTMTVDGVQAPIRAETVNGDITVKGGDGLVSLNTVEGSVILENAKGRIDVRVGQRRRHGAERRGRGPGRNRERRGDPGRGALGERGGHHGEWRHALRRHHPARRAVSPGDPQRRCDDHRTPGHRRAGIDLHVPGRLRVRLSR